MDEQLDRLLADHLLADDVQQVHHHVLQLRAFDVDGHLERAGDRHLVLRLAPVCVQQRPQADDRRWVEPDPVAFRDAGIVVHHAFDQRQRPQVAGFVARHAEPELPQLGFALEDARELHVQRHRLLFEIDRGAQDVLDRGALRTPPQICALSHTTLFPPRYRATCRCVSVTPRSGSSVTTATLPASSSSSWYRGAGVPG